MNNEPVGLTQVEIMNALALGIPLYTHPVNPYQSITDTKIEPTVVSYTNPVKELDEDFDAICLENKRLQAEIEALKDKLDEAEQRYWNNK